jgi:hypothetical protein
VGSDYYCDTGGETAETSGWFLDAPLWYGDATTGFGAECRQGGDPSWFTRVLDEPTSDPIEIRLMTDQPGGDEDVGVYQMELYVR